MKEIKTDSIITVLTLVSKRLGLPVYLTNSRMVDGELVYDVAEDPGHHSRTVDLIEGVTVTYKRDGYYYTGGMA